MKIGKWDVEYDRDATRTAYEKIENFCVEQCQCVYCKNFEAIRDKVYSEEFVNMLKDIGIDPRKEAEVYYIKAVDKNRHLYGGWFHFVGRYNSNGFEDLDGQSKLLKINDKIEMSLSDHTLLVDGAFKSDSVVQLEFRVEVPWVIENI
ncbi:hypothetical protein ACFLRI_01445 [Bacteroidota bacterium]